MKTQGTKLSTYVNNLFTTCDDMETALSQAAIIAGGADNAAAVHTAVHMVLNTAIKLHQADMAKANAPLLEMIESEIQKSFTVVQNSIEHALENYDRKMDEKIESAIDEIDLNQNVADWMDNNFDLENALSGLSVRINFD
jgi:cell fate (sporulation/competence/biofilm development) regulator YlbF (YheA/YmcA/DUF963 family)